MPTCASSSFQPSQVPLDLGLQRRSLAFQEACPIEVQSVRRVEFVHGILVIDPCPHVVVRHKGSIPTDVLSALASDLGRSDHGQTAVHIAAVANNTTQLQHRPHLFDKLAAANTATSSRNR